MPFDRDINRELAIRMLLAGLLNIARTKDTRCEVASTVVENFLRMMHIGKVMLTLHWFKVVASAEESLYFGVVVVVVHRLDLLWVRLFVLNVVELVRKASMRIM